MCKITKFSGILCLLVVLAQAHGSDVKPPKISEPNQPETRYITKDTNVTIKCHAEGEPSPTYKWRKDGAPIQVSNRATGIRYNATKGVLYIPYFTRQDEGIYMCEACTTFTKSAGNTTTATSLSPPITLLQTRVEKFKDKPKISKEISVREYNYVKLLCEYKWEVVAPNAVYNWYKAMSKIPVDDGRLFVDQAGNLHYSYVLKNDTTVPQSYLECGIYSPEEKVVITSSSNYLNVDSTADPKTLPPKLQYSNTKLIVPRFGHAKLECMFSGYDPQPPHYPTTRWYDDNGREITSTGDKYSLSDDSRTLTINSVEEEDEKNYYCQAQSSIAESEKEPVFLDVTSAPIFDDPENAPEDQTVPEHQNAVFHCNARSAFNEKEPNPPQWYINGVRTGVHTDGNRFLLSEDKKMLTIKDVRTEDFLCVQCEVTNHVGTTWRNGCLQVVEALDLPEVGAVSSFDAENAIDVSQLDTYTDSANVTAGKSTMAASEDSSTMIVIIIIAVLAIITTIVIVIVVIIRRQQRKRDEYRQVALANLHDVTITSPVITTDKDKGTLARSSRAKKTEDRIVTFEEPKDLNNHSKSRRSTEYEDINGHIYQSIPEDHWEHDVMGKLSEETAGFLRKNDRSPTSKERPKSEEDILV